MINKNNPYRLDYIGQDIYELNGNCYQKVRKSGSVYIFPTSLNIDENGMIYNFESYNAEHLRIRMKEDYVVIEPSGIIVPNENITPVEWNTVNCFADNTIVSPRNSKESIEVAVDTFFGNYSALDCIDKDEFDNDKNELIESINSPQFNYVCLFLYYLKSNGINNIDLLSLKEYLNELLENGNYDGIIQFDSYEIINQFIALMYVGILHTDYDKFKDLVIDDSVISIEYLKQKYDEYNNLYDKVREFASGFEDFNNKSIKKLVINSKM